MPVPRFRFLPALLATTMIAASGTAATNSIQPTWILHNGRIVTQDEGNRTVSAIAVLGDRIVASGTDAEMLALRGGNTCIIDLADRAVVPGFADGHIHSKPYMPESTVDLTPVRSMRELLAAVQAQVARSAPGDIIVTNSDWHEAQLEELRLPTRWDLDTVSPDIPVVVIRGGHQYILNSAALARWNITRETQAPPGGQITVDSRRGDINGELVDRARDLVELPSAPRRNLEERLADLQQEQRLYNSLGLTSVRVPGVSLAQMRDYEELARRGDMTVRTSVLIRWDRRTPAEQFRSQLEQWPVRSRFGNEWLMLDGVKLGVDGGYEGGWMREPYAEPYGLEGTYRGLNTAQRDLFVPVVRMLNEVGIRPSTHAVGDAAVDLVLDAYEEANRDRSIVDQRWAIEHAFITQPEQIQRIRDLGIVISAQSHLYLAGPSLLRFWGRERTEMVAPVRAWLDAGVPVAGGTDNKLPYVPASPILTFYHWVSRDSIGGVGQLGPDQAITRQEALRIATLGNAFLTFEEGIKGTLEPGKLADMVVLSQDIMTIPAQRIPETQVLGTMVGGRFVFQRPELGANCQPRS